MIKKFVIILLLLFQGFCFAYNKQSDEYSCGIFSAFNLIENSCKNCTPIEYDKLRLLLKTDESGTTSQNLCEGLNKYFKSQNKIIDIRYYGIKKVTYYKADNKIDLQKLKNFLDNGYYAILNIGIYKTDKKTINRIYGHYVNLISINKNKLVIFDPYDKHNNFSKWNTKKTNILLNNINDNEEYENETEYIKINSQIPYLEKDEMAFINGIILIKIVE